MLVMKKLNSSTTMVDTLQAIGIITGFYALMAIVAIVFN